MKITFCSYSERDFVAGPDSWQQRLLPSLRRRGIDSELLFFTGSPQEECPAIHWARANGFNYTSIRWQRFTEDAVRWLLRKTAESRPDIFVPNFVLSAYYASRWIRSAGIPTVGVMHSDESYYHAITDEFVFGKSQFQLSALVCVSQFLERMVLDKHPARVVVRRIPCGTPVPAGIASFTEGPLRLAYVGRLIEEQKRISEVTRALCRVVREVPNTEAVLFGAGPGQSIVEDILRTEGSGLPIHLEGHVPTEMIQEQLLKCHAIVLLSDYEGLPIALMEAMACGVVPICLHIRSGVTELVEHDTTGLLVGDRGDSLVAAARSLAESKQTWQRLSRNARDKVINDYSNEVCAAAWEELFRELKANANGAGAPRIPVWLRLPPVHPDVRMHDIRQSSRDKLKTLLGSNVSAR